MITAKMTKVSPEQAKQWRTSSRNFRSLEKSHARRIADDIIAGRWEKNGVPIVLNCNGSVIDGQHRLRAIELAGIPVEALVVTGVTEFSSIDTGKRRNLKDSLQNNGEKYPALLAGATNWYHKLSGGRTTEIVWSRNTSVPGGLSLLDKHPGLRTSVAKVAPHIQDLLFPAAALAALHYMLSEKDREMADIMVASLTTAAPDLPATDPIHLLRSMLIKDQGRRTQRAATALKVALAIKVWNSWQSGEPILVLKWKATGPRAESFPQVA